MALANLDEARETEAQARLATLTVGKAWRKQGGHLLHLLLLQATLPMVRVPGGAWVSGWLENIPGAART